jgi:hypothetical protein
MALFTRAVSLSVKRGFFGVAMLSYITIAVFGWIYVSMFGDAVFSLPNTQAWGYLTIEGLFIILL